VLVQLGLLCPSSPAFCSALPSTHLEGQKHFFPSSPPGKLKPWPLSHAANCAGSWGSSLGSLPQPIYIYMGGQPRPPALPLKSNLGNLLTCPVPGGEEGTDGREGCSSCRWRFGCGCTHSTAQALMHRSAAHYLSQWSWRKLSNLSMLAGRKPGCQLLWRYMLEDMGFS